MRADGILISPAALWKDYDPNHGDFKEEIVKQETREGVLNRDSYISAYVLGEEKSLTLRAIANDVVIGLMSATLQRP